MIDPEAITEAKRALGRQLAACREAAGYNQHQLAPLIHYGRSTIANAETGYSTCSRTFWERCDRALGADAALLRGYDDLQALIRAQRAQVAELTEAQRVATFRQLHDRHVGEASDVEIAAGSSPRLPAVTLSLDGTSPGPGPDTVVLRVQLDGREVVVPLSRRLLLQAGVGSFVEAFALGQQVDLL